MSLDRKKSHQERPLGLFRSPTNPDDEELEGSESPPEFEDVEAARMKGGEQAPTVTHQSREDRKHRAGPSFKRHPEATPSELFYDLFFVANLATFTTQNEVSNGKGLSNYIGYFCIIWFTWFQVALFDVRFSRDCVFERVCRTIQFGVMVGFSFIAYYFDPAGADNGFVDGKSLSLLLMVSRLVLFFQYIGVWLCLRPWPDKSIPMWLMILCSFVSAMVFLGVSFNFNTSGDKHLDGYAFVSWYVVSAVEAVVHIAISCKVRFFGYKGTHLVERMGLMTLIVLGEGILGLSTAVVDVWGNTNYYNGLAVAVMSVILLIYSIYQLYFDTHADDHFGTIRQQIWAVLHFPLHMALVLFDEGTKQFIIWNVATRQQNEFYNFIDAVPIFTQIVDQQNDVFTGAQNSTAYFSSQAAALWNSIDQFTALPDVLWSVDSANSTLLNEFSETVKNGVNEDSTAIVRAVIGFWGAVAQGIFSSFSIEGEKAQETGIEALDLFNEAQADQNLFDLVFVYFYVATGLVLLLILALWILSKRSRHTWFDYVRFAVWAAAGVTLCFMALLDLSGEQDNDPGDSFINGDWVLPTPMLMIVGVVIVFHLPLGRN